MTWNVVIRIVARFRFRITVIILQLWSTYTVIMEHISVTEEEVWE